MGSATRPRVGYLGPEGTFSEEALLASAAPEAVEPVPLQTIYDAITSLRQGELDWAIVSSTEELAGENYQIERAGAAAEADERLRSGQFDCVLMDCGAYGGEQIFLTTMTAHTLGGNYRLGSVRLASRKTIAGPCSPPAPSPPWHETQRLSKLCCPGSGFWARATVRDKRAMDSFMGVPITGS